MITGSIGFYQYSWVTLWNASQEVKRPNISFNDTQPDAATQTLQIDLLDNLTNLLIYLPSAFR